MGHNVQSQAGVTIADVYDVKGSQAPIERILMSDVQAVHEMGKTIQSERFSMVVRRVVTGDIGQSTVFAAGLSDLPAGVTRILNVSVSTDNAARVARCAVLLQQANVQRESPIWVWDAANADTITSLSEGSVGSPNFLRSFPEYDRVPSLITGPDQPQAMPNVFIRGATTAFGAGTVECTLLLLIAFSAIGGISSRGLPVPSW